MTTKDEAEKPVTRPAPEVAKTADDQAAGPGTTMQATPPEPIKLGDDGKPLPPEEASTKREHKKAASDPVVDQGIEAKELGLDEDACPYGEGDNRDNWLKGHGKGKAPKTDK